jgi:hypothetical protein
MAWGQIVALPPRGLNPRGAMLSQAVFSMFQKNCTGDRTIPFRLVR